MKQVSSPRLAGRPAPWKLATALVLVYLCWGTTYLAIEQGVKTLPPALFAGTRVALAGLIVLAYLALRGGAVRLSGRDALWTALSGGLMFVGGNGLLTFAETTVPSGVAAVLAATMPLWMALLEAAVSRGDRLNGRGWLGLLIGLVGVVVLLSEKLLRQPESVFADVGPFLVLGSAASWALGSCVYRHARPRAPHLTAAAYQMLFGGLSLVVVGLAMGEARGLTTDSLTAGGVAAFFYLLAVGSLIGFVAYNWLLAHASGTLASTCSYVNPAVALLVGWLLAAETLSPGAFAGVAVILVGVALVVVGGVRRAHAIGEEAPPTQPVPAAELPLVAGPARR